MNIKRLITCTIIASLLALAGCAISPEDEQRRKDMEADVDEILSYELDPLEYGEVRRCLSETEFRSYRALGNRHLLFWGRQDKRWVNVLRGRCPNLRDSSVFVMRPGAGSQLCEMDRFEVLDRGEPISRASTAPTCVLGEFKPVTEAQVEEIEHRLDVR